MTTSPADGTIDREQLGEALADGLLSVEVVLAAVPVWLAVKAGLHPKALSVYTILSAQGAQAGRTLRRKEIAAAFEEPISLDTVDRALGSLAKAGALVITAQHDRNGDGSKSRRPNRYFLRVTKPTSETAETAVDLGRSDPSRSSAARPNQDNEGGRRSAATPNMDNLGQDGGRDSAEGGGRRSAAANRYFVTPVRELQESPSETPAGAARGAAETGDAPAVQADETPTPPAGPEMTPTLPGLAPPLAVQAGSGQGGNGKAAKSGGRKPRPPKVLTPAEAALNETRGRCVARYDALYRQRTADGGGLGTVLKARVAHEVTLLLTDPEAPATEAALLAAVDAVFERGDWQFPQSIAREWAVLRCRPDARPARPTRGGRGGRDAGGGRQRTGFRSFTPEEAEASARQREAERASGGLDPMARALKDAEAAAGAARRRQTDAALAADPAAAAVLAAWGRA